MLGLLCSAVAERTDGAMIGFGFIGLIMCKACLQPCLPFTFSLEPTPHVVIAFSWRSLPSRLILFKTS